MSGADELRRQLDRPHRRAVADEPVPALERAPRTKKIRMTIDLVPQEFDEFREWRNAKARELGRGRVNGTDVMIALLRRLMADEDLQRDIVAVIERDSR
jgi:hypothetical protein